MFQPLPILLQLLAICTLGLGTDVCRMKPASCAHLPQATTKSCLARIARENIPQTTCTQPSTTITKTRTVTPSVTSVTVWRTAVQTNDKTVSHTVFSTAITVSAKTVHSTITVPATVMSTATSTTTLISTSTLPFNDACIVARDLQGNRKPQDDCCSCFLTSTSLCGRATITITATAQAPTHTVTATRHSTATRIPTLEVVVLVTQTAITTSVTTTTLTKTTTLDATIIATSSAVATIVADPCANPYLFGQPLTSSNTLLRMTSDTTGAQDCCRRCYESRDCVVYVLDEGNTVCRLYTTKNNSNNCVTRLCPLGKGVNGDIGQADGKQYGLGPCAGTFVR